MRYLTTVKASSGFLLRLLSALLVLAICSTSSWASVQVGDSLDFSRGAGGSYGGIFDVDNLENGVGTDFRSFCVEIEEHISFGSAYKVGGIDTVTHSGGRSLTSFVAWLFTGFV